MDSTTPHVKSEFFCETPLVVPESGGKQRSIIPFWFRPRTVSRFGRPPKWHDHGAGSQPLDSRIVGRSSSVGRCTVVGRIDTVLWSVRVRNCALREPLRLIARRLLGLLHRV